VKTREHYHVLQGLQGGYMPSLNLPCKTLREARSTAAALAKEARDQGDRVVGSARDGLYIMGELEYIKINSCDLPESECFDELE